MMYRDIWTKFVSFRRSVSIYGREMITVSPSLGRRHLGWAALVLLTVAATSAGWTIWKLRSDAIRAAVAETGNIATVLAGQISRSIQAIDTVLVQVRKSTDGKEFAPRPDVGTGLASRAFRDSLMEDLARLPQVFNIAVADKNGQVVVTTAGWPTPDINVADRDYFQDARDRTDGQLSTSIPIRNRINGNRAIVFARRLETPAGAFAGIVYASVNTKYLEDIYVSVQSVNDLIFTLLKADGTILFRDPDVQDSTGRQLSDQVGWLDALSKDGGTFRLVAQSDGNPRFVSARRLPEYPLIVNISVTEITALAGWRQQAAMIGAGSAALLFCSIYLLLAVKRHVRRLSQSEAMLAQKSNQLDTALNNMSQGLTMFDEQKRLIVCNAQFAKIYGLAPAQTQPGTPLKTILEARVAAGSDPQNVQNYVERRLEHTSKANSSCAVDTLRDGRSISVAYEPMIGGGWVTIHQDITRQKGIEIELERLARYDGLTGLSNRTLFIEKASAAMIRVRQTGESLAIMMLDLDRFKAVNDSLGHPAGDLLLQEVGRRLRRITREVDNVARFGGDEFAILQIVAKGREGGGTDLARRIVAEITAPFDLDGQWATIETSIGIANASQDGEDPETLIKKADLALYAAKSQGRNQHCCFVPAMAAEALDRRGLEEDLSGAIARNEFELHYQTIFDLESRECCGVEALVRWRHPKRGLISPDQFIPLAEANGSIVPLGDLILRQACAEVAKWPSHLKVAVNLSAAQFRQSDLVGALKSALKDTAMPAHRLELEITETVLLERNERTLAVLHKIKSLGVSIVLDDFGIGYSSIKYFEMFSFDKIKIDRSFIRNITSQNVGAAIVCAIAGLARSLGIAATAEGVETAEQIVALRAAGCQLAQGFLLSHPVPACELTFDPPAPLLQMTKAA
jgi:diguanylate cyclase (GGDEF)-like protein